MKPEKRTDKFEAKNPTPVDRIMASLPGTYYRLTEVAKILGLSERTLRRLIHKKVTQAPSEQLTQGGMQMYLYTPQDLEELRRYYKKEPHGES